jgi:hypothetical protein
MAELICESMDLWLTERRVVPPEWQPEDEPIKRELDRAFKDQSNIGWDQFFRGRGIAKAWSIPIFAHTVSANPEKHSPWINGREKRLQPPLDILDHATETTKRGASWN